MFRSHIVPHAGPSPTALTPAQVATLYNFPSATGASKTVGIISLGGGYSNADLQAAGIDPSRVTFVSVDGASNAYSGNPQSADLENMLDLTCVGLASAAKIRIYIAPNSNAGFVDSVTRAFAECDAVSCSWGQAETGWPAADEIAMRQAINGTRPFFCASGDSGPNDGTGQPVADFPACAEGSTACGGTRLIAAGNAIASESDWNDSGSGGGEEGYGVSRSILTPSWQHMGAYRVIPDLVLNAAPETGYGIHLKGTVYVVGGTSAAAPMAAAGYARLAEALGANVPAAFNAAIYGAGVAAFNPVQVDPGDPISCVGLGSPNLAKLVAALTPSTPVQPAPTCKGEVDSDIGVMLAAITAAKPAGGDVAVTIPWYATLTQVVTWTKQNLDATLATPAADALALAELLPVPAPPGAKA